MRPELLHSPIAKLARQLTILQKDEPELYRQLINHPRIDIGKKLEQEIAFRKECERNLVVQIKGPTGSGKSIAGGLRLARMLKKDWKAEGSIFYTNDEMMLAANKAQEGDVLFKDEDPIEHGRGTDSVSDAVANLESACARFSQLHLIFINPGETSHLADFIVDFSREESRRAGGKLVSAFADIGAKTRDEETLEERRINIGKVEFTVPEDLVRPYKTQMIKYKNALRISGGTGIRRDPFKRYQFLMPELINDSEFQAIPIRNNYFTGDHVEFLTSYYPIIEGLARGFLFKAWPLLQKEWSAVKIEKPLAAQ